MRREFKVPRMEEVLEHDRKLLFALKQSMGFVPNVYAFMTRSETALKRFMDFMDVSTVFDRIQTEAIHLVTSQVNQNPYCLAAHTALDTLVDFTCELVTNQGKVGPEMIGRFYQAGYTDACLVDLVMLVGMTTITNYLNNATWIPVDFPEAPVIICKCDCKK